MDEHLVAEAIARAWPRESARPGSPGYPFEPQLLAALRALEATATGPESERLVRELLGLVRADTVLGERVLDQLGALELEAERGPAKGRWPRSTRTRHVGVDVFYVTDRDPVESGPEVPRRYGGARGRLTSGLARVHLPDDHQMGGTGRAWPITFRGDTGDPEDQHGPVDAIDRIDRDTEEPFGSRLLAGQVRPLLERATAAEILVFVHGYNTGFEEALRRAAQIAYDVDFRGLMVLFSWPSEGATLRYHVDRENVRWALPDFEEVLAILLGEVGASRLHLLAHSMGNQLLVEWLGSAGARAARPSGTRLDQVVFAAPDVDADVFARQAVRFEGLAERYTLYASDRDRALSASRQMARHARAGQAGFGLVVVNGVDTLDASRLDTGLMSHSYFGDHTSVITDLHALFRHGHPPEERAGLRLMAAAGGGPYWEFRG